jgi:hypothetical protein
MDNQFKVKPSVLRRIAGSFVLLVALVALFLSAPATADEAIGVALPTLVPTCPGAPDNLCAGIYQCGADVCVTFQRLFSPSRDEHFFVSDLQELAGLSGFTLIPLYPYGQYHFASVAQPNGDFTVEAFNNFAVFRDWGDQRAPLYRCYNDSYGDEKHYLTTHYCGPYAEGQVGWIALQPDNYIARWPLYEIVDLNVGDHIYTTSYAEVQQATQGYYTYFGILGYVDAPPPPPPPAPDPCGGDPCCGLDYCVCVGNPVCG